MKKRILCLLVASLMLMTCFAGCAEKPAESPGASTPNATTPSETQETANPLITDKDTVVISLQTELQTLDVLGQQNIVTNECLSNIYDTLIVNDMEGNILPNVAESWEWDDAEKSYTFKIKQGVKFHDGTELKASDVKFTFDLIIGKHASFQTEIAELIDHAETIDDYTVKVYLKDVAANFLYLCSINVKLYSEKAYNEMDSFAEGIVSCGPYKLKSYDSATGAVLEAFEEYHGELKPKIKNAIFKIIPDANTQVVALETGELNLSRDFPMISLANIRENEHLDIYSHSSGLVYFIIFNLRENGPEPFKNKLVRQAINYCLDKEFMIVAAEEGMGEIANSIAPKGMSGWEENIPYYEYNVEKAKELMKEAGYENGFEFPALIVRDNKQKKVAEIALENLKAIGITTTLQVMENNAFVDDLNNGNFDMACTQLNLSSDGANGLVRMVTGNSRNQAGMSDAEIDQWYQEQSRILDMEERNVVLNKGFVKAAEEAYFAPTLYPQKSYAITKGLKITGYDKFIGVKLVYLEWE